MGMTMIDVLVFDGCEALDALGPYEVLAYCQSSPPAPAAA